ncbi:MAG: penicillin-binding transpeptidase domain-containing protein, partial [Eubacterium sp.]
NKFHISTLDPVADVDYAPMATGSLTSGVTTLEMTTAYQAFGNGGYYYEAYAYYKIEDSKGNVLIEKEPETTKEEALSENSAGVMNKLLQTVMTSGTGRYYKISNVECFGKTGTTSDSKDRWFMGGTPEYMCGVWYGYDKPKEVHYGLSYNPSGTLWNLVMKNIYKTKSTKKKDFTIPKGVVHKEYSYSNGMLCSGTGNWGWFDEDNLPARTSYSGGSGSGYTRRRSSSSSSGADESTSSAGTTQAAQTEPAQTEPTKSEPATEGKKEE